MSGQLEPDTVRMHLLVTPLSAARKLSEGLYLKGASRPAQVPCVKQNGRVGCRSEGLTVQAVEEARVAHQREQRRLLANLAQRRAELTSMGNVAGRERV